MLPDEIERYLLFASQQGKPASSPFLRADFHAPEKIAFGDNSGQPSLGVNDRQTADVMRQHDPDGGGHRGVGANGDHMT